MKYASHSVNTEIIKIPYRNYSKYSKAFALLLIGVHEMIDYFSGVDTIFLDIMVYFHRRLAVVNLF